MKVLRPEINELGKNSKDPMKKATGNNEAL
jgi:hypothetical protein